MKTLNLRVGMKVYSTDGENGNLIHVVLNPGTQEITEIVVEKGMRLMKQTYVLPITLVEGVSNTAILLTIHSSEFTNYPEYRETEIEETSGYTSPAEAIT